MGGLSGVRAAMEGKYSAEELEVARILMMLPRLVWEADHRAPCTHNLRWAARKRRSACGDDPPEPARTPTAAAPPPPPRLPARPPPAAEKLRRKRGKEAAAAAAEGAAVPAPSREDARAEAHQRRPPAAEEADAATAATMGNSSPETPLDFCPSAEEADAKARAQACAPDVGRPTAKKPKLKHEHLSKQFDQSSRTRTELQKEVAEARKRAEALRVKNSELMELRIKLKKDGEHHRQQGGDQHLLHGRGCLDLLPTVPVRPVDAAHAPDRAHPQTPQQQQLHQHAWPQHWVDSHVVFQQVAPGFPIHPSPPPPPPAAAAGGSEGWRRAGAPAWRANGDGSASLAGKVPDLNSDADVESALDAQQQHPQQQQQQLQQHPQQQQQQQLHGNYYQLQQQLEQRRSSPDEQRAARKKRIEMIQRRRNGPGAAGSRASVKVPGFR